MESGGCGSVLTKCDAPDRDRESVLVEHQSGNVCQMDRKKAPRAQSVAGWVNYLRLRVLGAAGLASGLASSHFGMWVWGVKNW